MTDGTMIGNWLGVRTFSSTVVPLSLVALPVLLLLLSGAPGEVDLGRGISTLLGWGAAEIVLAVVVLLVATLTAQPLVGLYLRSWATSGLVGLGKRWHRGRWAALVKKAQAPDLLPESQLTAWQATVRWRRRYPADDADVVRSALGNALVAAGSRGHARHGLDPALVWPRLYPLLTPNVKAIVDDRRLSLDTTAVLVVAWLLSAGAWFGLLIPTGSGLLWFTLLPLLLSAVTYRAAITRAVAYGEAVEIAFDLCRSAVFPLAREPVPVDAKSERAAAERVNAWIANDGNDAAQDNGGGTPA